MDGLSILFGFLTLVFIVVLLGMNTLNNLTMKPFGKEEGFQSSQTSQQSPIELQIRTVLDPMAVPEVCPVFEKLRTNMRKNESGTGLSPQEISAKVEKTLAIAIPGGALPCPLFTYPRAGSTDYEWLDFLQKLPSDFGARVVFMAIYAHEKLTKSLTDLNDALAGKPVALQRTDEGFSTICPPDVAASRREAAKKQETASCTLPEDMSPAQIQDAVTDLLKKLVATKVSVLSAKGIDPNLDIRPLLTEANQAAQALETKANQAQAGTLTVTM